MHPCRKVPKWHFSSSGSQPHLHCLYCRTPTQFPVWRVQSWPPRRRQHSSRRCCLNDDAVLSCLCGGGPARLRVAARKRTPARLPGNVFGVLGQVSHQPATFGLQPPPPPPPPPLRAPPLGTLPLTPNASASIAAATAAVLSCPRRPLPSRRRRCACVAQQPCSPCSSRRTTGNARDRNEGAWGCQTAGPPCRTLHARTPLHRTPAPIHPATLYYRTLCSL